jgi:hypothetical protein
MRLRHVAIVVLVGVAGLGFIAVASTRAEDAPARISSWMH